MRLGQNSKAAVLKRNSEQSRQPKPRRYDGGAEELYTTSMVELDRGSTDTGSDRWLKRERCRDRGELRFRPLNSFVLAIFEIWYCQSKQRAAGVRRYTICSRRWETEPRLRIMADPALRSQDGHCRRRIEIQSALGHPRSTLSLLGK